MSQQNNNNKSKLLIFLLIAIIVLLVAGIVYQFIVIKSLENQQNLNAIINLIKTKNILLLKH